MSPLTFLIFTVFLLAYCLSSSLVLEPTSSLRSIDPITASFIDRESSLTVCRSILRYDRLNKEQIEQIELVLEPFKNDPSFILDCMYARGFVDPRLYNYFGADVQKNVNVVKLFFEKTLDSSHALLYDRLPRDLKEDDDFMLFLFQTSIKIRRHVPFMRKLVDILNPSNIMQIHLDPFIRNSRRRRPATVSVDSDFNEIARIAVKKNGMFLENAEDAKGIKDVVLAAVTQNGDALKFAAASMQNDSEIVMAAVKNNGRSLGYASKDRKNDREIALEAVKNDGRALSYLPMKLKLDHDIAKAAVSNQYNALYSLPDSLKNDLDIMNAAVSNDGRAIDFAGDEIRRNPQITLKALDTYSGALSRGNKELKNNREVVLKALSKDAKFGYLVIGDTFLGDEEMILAAVKHNSRALGRALPALKDDKSFNLKVVRVNGYALKVIKPALLEGANMTEFQSIATESKRELLKTLRRDGMLLKDAPFDAQFDVDAVYAAVSQNGLAYQFAKGDSKKDLRIIQMALYSNPDSQEFMSDQVLNKMRDSLKEDPRGRMFYDETLNKKVQTFFVGKTFENIDPLLNYINTLVDQSTGRNREEDKKKLLQFYTQKEFSKYKTLVNTIQDSVSPEKASLKIATFNLFSGKLKHMQTRLKENLSTSNFDVVLFQETPSNLIVDGYLKVSSKGDMSVYVSQRSNWMVTGIKSIGTIKEFCNTKRMAISITLEYREARKSYRAVTITNVHLCGGKFDERRIGNRIREGKLTTEELEHMKSSLLQAIVSENPTFVVGDFNSDASGNNLNQNFLKENQWTSKYIRSWNNLPHLLFANENYNNIEYEHTARYGSATDAIYFEKKIGVNLSTHSLLPMGMAAFDSSRPKEDRFVESTSGSDHDGISGTFEISATYNSRCKDIFRDQLQYVTSEDAKLFKFAENLFTKDLKQTDKIGFQVFKVKHCTNEMLEKKFDVQKNYYRERKLPFEEEWNSHGTQSIEAVTSILDNGFQVVIPKAGKLRMVHGPRFYTAKYTKDALLFAGPEIPILFVKRIYSTCATDTISYNEYFNFDPDTNLATEKNGIADENIPDCNVAKNGDYLISRKSSQLLPVFAVFHRPHASDEL